MTPKRDLEVRLCDIGVPFMNTSMPEGEPVFVEPPEGLYDSADTVSLLKRALKGQRDTSRLFHEHFAHILTTHQECVRSEAQSTLSVNHTRKVYIAAHVDDLTFVGSSSQLPARCAFVRAVPSLFSSYHHDLVSRTKFS